MSNLYDAVYEYYESQEWKYDYDEEENLFRMRMNLKSVDSCSVFTRIKNEEALLIYTVFPIKVPESKRDAMARFFIKANYNMILGNFEMDYSDGEIRYKVITLCGDIPLEHAYVERAVDMGFYMLDRYGDAILSVLFGGANPDEAIYAVEGDDEEEEDED